MRLTGMIAAVIAMLAGSPALAQAVNWEVIASTANGAVSIDRAALQRYGDMRVARSRIEFSAAKPDGTKFMYLIVSGACASRTVTVVHFAQYRADGLLLSESSVPEAERIYAVAAEGSFNAVILATICR